MDKVKKRGYTSDCSAKVIQELLSKRYLNDEELAAVMVRNFKSYKQYGFQMVKLKLMQKQIPSNIIEEVLQRDFSEEDEIVVGKKLMVKLVKGKKNDKNNLRAKMLSRGFRNGVVFKILSDIHFT